MEAELAVGGVILLCVLISGMITAHHHVFRAIWLVLAPIADRGLRHHKRRLLRDIAGTVVEIGPGIGTNMKYLDPSKVRSLTLVEPNTAMHGDIRKNAARHGFPDAALVGMGASSIPLEDASADVVFSTLVLCSVPSVREALDEIYRVLRPGGRFVFLEHVGDREVQEALRVPWSIAGDGCQLDRDTFQLVAALPWRVDGAVVAEDNGLWLTQPTAFGVATKPGGGEETEDEFGS